MGSLKIEWGMFLTIKKLEYENASSIIANYALDLIKKWI